MTTASQVSSDIKMKKILFVCTGNTCRSPMAEALFNHEANADHFSASSCGIYGDGVSRLSANACEVLKEKGIYFNHVSTPVSDKILSDADIIIGMTHKHATSLIAMYPEYSEKIYAMPTDISDPYGGDIETYRKCRDEIQECVDVLIKTLCGESND